MKKVITLCSLMFLAMMMEAKTLIVYYSYSHNVESIVNELTSQIEADVVEILPAEKGLDYAANGYAIGSALISAIRSNPNDAASYPAIDPVNINLGEYDTVIIGAPLWWSSMAAPLQTFLFHYGKEMAGKNIGLIVSSHSSGISGVEADARRLIPEGKFLTPSLWIKSAQTSDARTLLSDWLKAIDYSELTNAIEAVKMDNTNRMTIHDLSGSLVGKDMDHLDAIPNGIYVINGKKILITDK